MAKPFQQAWGVYYWQSLYYYSQLRRYKERGVEAAMRHAELNMKRSQKGERLCCHLQAYCERKSDG